MLAVLDFIVQVTKGVLGFLWVTSIAFLMLLLVNPVGWAIVILLILLIRKF